jgi:hypothetical protein
VTRTTRVRDVYTGYRRRDGSVKKLLILILLVLGGLAVWRKVAAQRADLDLWSEATAPDDY